MGWRGFPKPAMKVLASRGKLCALEGEAWFEWWCDICTKLYVYHTNSKAAEVESSLLFAIFEELTLNDRNRGVVALSRAPYEGTIKDHS